MSYLFLLRKPFSKIHSSQPVKVLTKKLTHASKGRFESQVEILVIKNKRTEPQDVTTPITRDPN